jgi:hypothetical protein
VRKAVLQRRCEYSERVQSKEGNPVMGLYYNIQRSADDVTDKDRPFVLDSILKVLAPMEKLYGHAESLTYQFMYVFGGNSDYRLTPIATLTEQVRRGTQERREFLEQNEL